jgi:hypothetical protein
MKKKLIILAALLTLTGAGCSNKTNGAQIPIGETPVICTQDARQCADGSYVGRTGPNCEFAACPAESKPAPTTNTDWKTITIGGVATFSIPPHCTADPGAGTTYITCPTLDNETPTPEFTFSSDGIQVNMKRWEGLSSPYWNDVIASMRIITPLTHAIQINIEK